MLSHPSDPTAAHRGRLFRIVVMAFIVVTSMSGSALAFQDENADEEYAFARGLYKTRRYDQASKAFRQFLIAHPEHPRNGVARLYYGLTLSNLNQYKEARDQFSAFIKENPGNNNLPDASYRRGECSFYLTDYATAEQQLRAFRTEYPDHALVNWAYLFEAQSQLAAKKWAVSQTTFEELLKRKPEEQTIRDAEYGLGRSLEGQNKISEAFEYYRKLVKANDRVVSPRALSRMGSLYFQAGDLEAAVKAYSLIDERYKQSQLAIPARLNVGLAYLRLEDYPNAVTWMERAKSDEANRPRADILHAVGLQKQGQFPAADGILKKLYEEFKTNTQHAPEILYYQADGMRLSGRPEEAVPLFSKIASDWPTSPFADDSLFFAADSAFQAKQDDTVQELLQRLDTNHPKHEYKGQSQLLRGRIYAASQLDVDLRKAITALTAAADSAKKKRTQALARFYLAGTYQRLRDHPSALKSAQPLIDEIIAGKHRDLAGVIVLTSVSQLALGQFVDAADSASGYIRMFPTGPKIVDAREARAIAEAKQGNREPAESELKTLDGMSLPDERMATATLRVAEIAWERRMYDWSAQLYQKLTLDRQSPLRPNGFSGHGWSLFEQDKYVEAADAFGALVTNHPNHKLAPEAAFMQGESLRNATKTPDAITAYRAAFEKYLPAEAAPALAETRTPTRFSFEGGRQLANLLATEGQIEEADAVYKQLTAAFPKAEKMDRILDRWAFMLLDSDPNRSNELFRFLIKERPNSPLVPNARLVLAESDMLEGRFEDATKIYTELINTPSAPEKVRQSAMYNMVTVSDRNEVDADVQQYADKYLAEFPQGVFADHVRLFQAETLVRQAKLNEAQEILVAIRGNILEPNTEPQKWHGRTWVVLAETYLQHKQYDKARDTAAEMLGRADTSDYYYQMYDVMGRTYLKQAKFDEARAAFRKVITDKNGRRTPTAGKCQLFIGDTWVNQQNYANALPAYQKAYFNYVGLPDVQAAGLFQAAGCELKLLQNKNALKSYKDLIAEFPTSSYAKQAQTKIDQLKTTSGL